MQTVAPRFEEIEADLNAVSEMGGDPKGTIRITAFDYATDTLVATVGQALAGLPGAEG